MTPLAVFGICFVIALAFFILPYLILGSGITMLYIIFPAMAAEGITGERGLDLGRKSFIYTTLLLLFVLTQVVLLAAIFFGIYCFAFGYPAPAQITPERIVPVLSAKNTLLFTINKILLVVLSYFFFKFIYQTIRYRDAYRSMNKKSIYVNQIISFVMFPLAFIYLIGCLNYFLDYPAKTTIGVLPSIAGCIYICFVVYSLIRIIFFYTKTMQDNSSEITFRHMLPSFIAFAESIVLVYFFLQMRFLLSIH